MTRNSCKCQGCKAFLEQPWSYRTSSEPFCPGHPSSDILQEFFWRNHTSRNPEMIQLIHVFKIYPLSFSSLYYGYTSDCININLLLDIMGHLSCQDTLSHLIPEILFTMPSQAVSPGCSVATVINNKAKYTLQIKKHFQKMVLHSVWQGHNKDLFKHTI